MALQLEQKYELGEFLLEPDKRQLSRNGEPVHLSKLPFHLLLYLVEHRERVVTRRELLERFWGGHDVYEDTLRKSVGAVRRALGDGERSRYVETCRGEGYRYVGAFRELPLFERDGAVGGAPEPPRAVEADAKARDRRWPALTAALLAVVLAVAQIKLAQELDPLNVVMNVDVAEILLLARRYDEAIAGYHHALEMDPNRANAYEGLAWAYEGKGMYEEAVAAFLKSFALNGRSPDEVAELRRAYESGGMRGYWQKSLEQELRRDYTEPLHVGNFYTKLGDKDSAFAWYERAYKARSPSLLGAKSSAKVDSLRSDPRFADLVSRIGLP